ncbi:hypothetical protein [Pedobacter sp.]
MMTNYLMPNKSGGKVAAIAGLAALAGVALIFAMPKTRKACGQWLGDTIDQLKDKLAQRKNADWEQDLQKAEALKGPVKRRKDTAKINVPSAGTTAWKDEWSSE